MKSKEAYNYLLGLLESGGDMRWSLVKESMDKFKELIEQQSNPTFSECIKEWEERGWKVEEREGAIQIDYMKFGRISEIYIYKALKEVRILYENLHYEEFHLLSKTLKALEEMKDGK